VISPIIKLQQDLVRSNEPMARLIGAGIGTERIYMPALATVIIEKGVSVRPARSVKELAEDARICYLQSPDATVEQALDKGLSKTYTKVMHNHKDIDKLVKCLTVLKVPCSTVPVPVNPYYPDITESRKHLNTVRNMLCKEVKSLMLAVDLLGLNDIPELSDLLSELRKSVNRKNHNGCRVLLDLKEVAVEYHVGNNGRRWEFYKSFQDNVGCGNVFIRSFGAKYFREYITEEILSNPIGEVIQSPRNRKKIIALGKLFKDMNIVKHLFIIGKHGERGAVIIDRFYNIGLELIKVENQNEEV